MEKTDIFQLINVIEQLNNANIVLFTKKFSYPLGISPILVLAELKDKGPRKQMELAEMVGLTKGALTNISTKLVKLALVERLYDEEDRRIIRLRITDKGLEALQEAHKAGNAIYLDLFDSFSEDELNEYWRLQNKLLEASLTKKLL
ncbi:MarR family winged helix-turn-helix transcriptional regulator [Planococcus sp. YIM B11945]|uniref:MarR family winged helix-turn-helix transcriptional regulator n=1 Tax=Planococcus sp. YIM B11945 TaxID=3435410 RepID=UPI003D7C8234